MLYGTVNPHGGDLYGDPVALDFSANTNPFGTPQGVLDAVREVLPRLHQYPDPYCRALVGAISAAEGVPAPHILCGAGATELIYAYCDAVHPARAVELAPTFSEYALGLARVGCQVERFPLEQETEFVLGPGFLPFLAERRPDAVFLCNPNNPTGRTIPPPLLDEVLALCGRYRIRLFLDECFLDLSDRGESMAGRLSDHPQLLVLKAFTKSYGLAGLRLGYCMTADTGLLQQMSRAVQPWNLSLPAQAAGVAALKEREFLRRSREVIFAQRAWLAEALRTLGLWVCPSEANYLLFHGPDRLHLALRAHKIAIRNCDNYHGLSAGWYRVAVRLYEENRVLVSAMERALKGGDTWPTT